MSVRFVIALMALVAAVSAATPSTVPVTITNSRGGSIDATVNVIASGFTWVENLIFDGDGRLIVTDAVRGEIYSITLTAGVYTPSVIVSGLGRVLGLAVDPNNSTHLYACARLASNSADVIISFSSVSSDPSDFTVVANLPSGFLPNGMGLDVTSGLLYATSEGNFLPDGGRVFEINPATGSVRDLNATAGADSAGSGFQSADGLWIDQSARRLYVGQLIWGNIWVYDLSAGAPIGFMRGLGGGLLDDFTLSHDSSSFFGAQWWGRSVQRFAVQNDNSTATVLDGINHPTSMRFGRGAGFNESSLYISEGDGVFSFQSSCRVLELPNAEALFAAAEVAEPAPGVESRKMNDDDESLPLSLMIRRKVLA